MTRDGETAMDPDNRRSRRKAPLRLVAPSREAGTTGDAVDTALITRIAAGDRAAMQVLYVRHHARVRRLILRLVGNAPEADQLVHEVFLDVWRNAGRFAGRSRVSTWLIAIARQKANRASRSRSTPPRDGGFAKRLEDPANHAEVIADNKKTDSALCPCVAQLWPVDREVTDLNDDRGRAIDDVAASICVARNTVETSMLHARKRLAELLCPQGMTGLPVV
jgi:RNA polymerase sigma-70 factor, ECF subfamily